MANNTDIRVLFNRMPDVIRKAPQRAKEAVKKATFDVEAQAKTRVRVDTGNLKNSLRSDFVSDGYTGIVGTNVEYAAYVEFGTVRMSARPYLTPAADAVRPSFIKAMESLVD